MPLNSILHGQPADSYSNANISVSIGTVFALPYRAGSLVWQTIFGAAPASVQIDLEASLDNVTWDAIDSTTVTAGEVRTFATLGGKFIRARVISVTGGTTVTVRIVCQPL